MATLAASTPWTVAAPRVAISGLQRFAVAAIGLLIAFPSAGAALACALFLGLAIAGRSLRRVPDRAIVYLAAIVLSLIPALMVTPGPPAAVWTGFSALVGAFAFLVAGLTIGRSPSLIRDLLMGLCVAAVTHVLLAGLRLPQSPDWAFCAAGLLLAFGPTLETALQRGMAVTAGLAAAAMAFLGAGVAGAAAIATWAVLLGLSAWRSAGRVSYHVFLVLVALAAIALAAGWPRVSRTPVAERFVSAFERVVDGSLIPSVSSAVHALPFGLGAGHGRSDLAGVATELGLLGLAGFAALIAHPLRLGRRTKAPLLLMTFIPAAVVFMVENAMHAEPGFMLLLGVAGGCLAVRLSPPRDSASALRRHAPSDSDDQVLPELRRNVRPGSDQRVS